MLEDPALAYQAQLLASTGDLYQGLNSERGSRKKIQDTFTQTPSVGSHEETKYFKNAKWSPDGTTLLTSGADNSLKTFILYSSYLPSSSIPSLTSYQASPPDLLSRPNTGFHSLTPYANHTAPTPIFATTFFPNYDLSSPSSTLLLASPAHLPIRLTSTLTPGIVSSYPLVSPYTEAYIAPYSLLFFPDRTTTFLAGAFSEIAIFDAERNGEGPVSRLSTIPSRRKKIVGGGVGYKGIISAMECSADGLLATGTFGRWVGLYDGYGRGGTVGVFSLSTGDQDEYGSLSGTGVTQVLWSGCGRYLYVVERMSSGLQVFDVRATGKRVAWCVGRRARTQQRLGVEVWGREIWAGGTDGLVRVWAAVGEREGHIDPGWEFRAHDDAVSSSVLHPSGAILATSSGQRHPVNTAYTSNMAGEESEDGASSSLEPDVSYSGDNSLKVWSLSSGSPSL